jgi:hypothetical protein
LKQVLNLAARLQNHKTPTLQDFRLNKDVSGYSNPPDRDMFVHSLTSPNRINVCQRMGSAKVCLDSGGQTAKEGRRQEVEEG